MYGIGCRSRIVRAVGAANRAHFMYHQQPMTMNTPTGSFDTPEQAPPGDDSQLLDEDDRDFLEQILEEAEVAEEEFTDTFELEVGEPLDGNWWPSSDQIKGMEVPEGATFSVPKPSDWVEDTGKVHIAVDRARREYWSQLKAEVTQIKENVCSIPAIRDALSTGKKIDKALFDYLLGPESEVGRAIMLVTDMDELLYSQFIYSFILSLRAIEMKN